jgi:hypothetical protein
MVTRGPCVPARHRPGLPLSATTATGQPPSSWWSGRCNRTRSTSPPGWSVARRAAAALRRQFTSRTQHHPTAAPNRPQLSVGHWFCRPPGLSPQGACAALQTLGTIEWMTGGSQQAAAVLSQALATLHPSPPVRAQLLSHWAQFELQAQRVGGARALLQRARAESAPHIAALVSQAVMEARAGGRRAAAELFEQAVRLEPDNVRVGSTRRRLRGRRRGRCWVAGVCCCPAPPCWLPDRCCLPPGPSAGVLLVVLFPGRSADWARRLPLWTPRRCWGPTPAST